MEHHEYTQQPRGLCPGRYAHFKGSVYEVVREGLDVTNRPGGSIDVVIYHKDGMWFVRDKAEFLGVVRWPDNRLRSRWVPTAVLAKEVSMQNRTHQWIGAMSATLLTCLDDLASRKAGGDNPPQRASWAQLARYLYDVIDPSPWKPPTSPIPRYILRRSREVLAHFLFAFDLSVAVQWASYWLPRVESIYAGSWPLSRSLDFVMLERVLNDLLTLAREEAQRCAEAEQQG